MGKSGHGKVVLVIFLLIIGGIIVWTANQDKFSSITKDSATNQPSPTKAKSCTACNQDPVPETITLDRSSHDFGHMKEGILNSTTFTLNFPENSELKIGRLLSSCSCVKVSMKNRGVKSGGKAEIKVDLHSLTITGKQTFSFYVETLSPERGVIRGEVKADVERVPAKILIDPVFLHLGNVKTKREEKIAISNLTKSSMRILNAKSGTEGITVTAKLPAAIRGGYTFDLPLAIDPALLKKGMISSFIQIETDCPEHAILKIPVDGTCRK